MAISGDLKTKVSDVFNLPIIVSTKLEFMLLFFLIKSNLDNILGHNYFHIVKNIDCIGFKKKQYRCANI